MLDFVPSLVGFDALKTEVRREVDGALAPRDEFRDVFAADAVGQGEEGDIGIRGQPARVEAFVDVAFQIAQRRLAAAGQPCAEQRFVFGQMAARGDAAEVEPCADGEPFDVQMVDHRDNLCQK